LYAKGNFIGAAAAFKKATQLDPNLAEAYGNLGAVLLRLGQDAEAEKAFGECIRLDPSAQAKLERFRREARNPARE